MSLNIVLQNNTSAQHLYAHVTGRDSNNNLFFLRADGVTGYSPPSPSGTLQPVAQDCAIVLGGTGSQRTITIPRISGGRVWFCKDQPLKFFINPGPSVVEPAATNPSDPNYLLDWGFCELTYNTSELYVNISYVDFLSLAVSLKLENQSGNVRTVKGMPTGARDKVCAKLITQGQKDGKGWEKLVIKSKSGAFLRALSPNSGNVLIPGLFDGYFQPHVDAVWNKYTNETLTVNTQFKWGDAKGKVKNGKLTFDGVGSFGKPSASDIFSCNSGPFAHYQGVSDEVLNIGARLAAALNRSTLLKNSVQPEGENVDNYYDEAITNHYSRICHETALESRGYAFPYDDVGSSKGQDQSGFLNDPKPKVLTISVGKPL